MFFCIHVALPFIHTHMHARVQPLHSVCVSVCDTQLYSIGLLCTGDEVRPFILFILTNQSYYISGTLKWFAVNK